MNKMNSKLKVFIIVDIIVVLLCAGFYIYTLDYYRADEQVVEAYAPNGSGIQQIDQFTVFYPSEQVDANIGLIFYPGGKVEAIAYAPLLNALTQKGITCVLVKMPMNLAVFGINSADKVYDILPDIQHWYLSGHSLGGAMGSAYTKDNAHKLDGYIYMGSYPINDADIYSLAIYGSEDSGISIEELADVDQVLLIEGGNHAYFGNYGEQKGDGTASITREEQQALTVESIANFLQLD